MASIPKKYEVQNLKSAIEIGGLTELRFACDFADRIVAAVVDAGHEETLKKGFKAFRARNDYVEDLDSQPGSVHFRPLAEEQIRAPNKKQAGLGRFNPAKHPVLYLSTTPEVSLAETRALPTDTCTVATFETNRPIRIARLLEHKKEPILVFLEKIPNEETLKRWLLARTAEFISRRVSETDRDLHYRTCNLIASAFKEHGFGGLAYRTSFWSPGWQDKKLSTDQNHVKAANIVLFDPEAATPKTAGCYNVNWKRPEAEIVESGFLDYSKVKKDTVS